MVAYEDLEVVYCRKLKFDVFLINVVLDWQNLVLSEILQYGEIKKGHLSMLV